MTSHTRNAYGKQGIKFLPATNPKMTDDQYREVIKARVTIRDTGCWEMPGFQYKLRGVKSHDKGYVNFSYRGKARGAHRVAYALFIGPIQPGLKVCHTCDNPPCCNPDHLFLGTDSDNALDRVAKKRDRNRSRTHCIRGHELAGDNLRITKTPRGYRRQCKACERLYKSRNPQHIAWRREWQRKRRVAKRALRTDEERA